MPSTLLFPCPFLVLENAIFIFISCATNVKFGPKGLGPQRHWCLHFCKFESVCISI